jgi:hypothetical protein
MKHKIKKDFYIFKIFIFIQKYLKTSNVIFLKNCKYFKEHVAKKNPSKHLLCEKIKMFKKGPFVVESFVIVGSFDYEKKR